MENCSIVTMNEFNEIQRKDNKKKKSQKSEMKKNRKEKTRIICWQFVFVYIVAIINLCRTIEQRLGSGSKTRRSVSYIISAEPRLAAPFGSFGPALRGHS